MSLKSLQFTVMERGRRRGKEKKVKEGENGGSKKNKREKKKEERKEKLSPSSHMRHSPIGSGGCSGWEKGHQV